MQTYSTISNGTLIFSNGHFNNIFFFVHVVQLLRGGWELLRNHLPLLMKLKQTFMKSTFIYIHTYLYTNHNIFIISDHRLLILSDPNVMLNAERLVYIQVNRWLFVQFSSAYFFSILNEQSKLKSKYCVLYINCTYSKFFEFQRNPI